MINSKAGAAQADFNTGLGTTVNLPATLVATGLSNTEVVDIQISPDGTNYTNLFVDGVQVQLTTVNNAVTIYGPGRYRIVKAATANPVTVGLLTEGSV